MNVRALPFVRAVLPLVAILTLPFTTTRAAQQPPETTAHNVRVDAVASDQLSLDVAVGPPSACNHLHLIVQDMVVKDRLRQLNKGDRITVVYATGAKGENVLDAFCLDAARPGPRPGTRFWVLLASAGITWLLYGLFSGFKPHTLMIGADNRYSNSKFQIAIWFFIVITSYIATLWLRTWYAGWDFIGGVNIPQNLLLISGMSVLTFGGAAGITARKVAEAGNGQAKAPAPHPDFFLDLTHNDGGLTATGALAARQLDFGDFQMLVITLIAVAAYLFLVFHFLGTIEESRFISLPDVDTTILAAFGLGQGAYLTKKAVGKVGQS